MKSGRGEKCLFSLRVPAETVLEKTRGLYDDLEDAKKVGVLATRLLRDAYLKDPTEICGKSPKTLMAGAIYVAAILKGLPKPQYEIACVCNCTQNSVYIRYKHLARVLGYPSEDFVREVLKERRW